MRAEKDAAEVPGDTAGGLPWAGREQLMIETLEEGLTQLYRDRVRVRAIRDKELGKSSSFAIYRIDAQLESGVVLPTIFKDLNSLQQQHGAQELRGLELERSRREIWAYRRVLPRLALGTPDLYGFRWEPRRGNLWLFLEDVGPHRIGHRLDLALYEQAAAWAGRFHEATAKAWDDEQLLRFDQAHYERQGRRLEAYLERIAAADRPLVEHALARYGELVKLVDRLPQSLIHGEFFGKNVMIRPGPAKNALAVVDWETLATGPQYVDLVSISAGRWTWIERMVMRRAYFEARRSAAGRPPVHPPAREDAAWKHFNDEVDIVAVLQAVAWLGFWLSSDVKDRKYASRVSRWLSEVRLAMERDVMA